MPLSEHEQKMLDEMERQLFADDPRLARTFRKTSRPRRSSRRVLIGVGAMVVGLAALVLAVLLPAIWLGVLGFVLMLAGAIYAVTAPQASEEDETPGGSSKAGDGKGASRGDFMKRMEQRWEKRGDDPRR